MAQTKIKAGLFEGIIGNGTDGYFLMSNGDGTMTWSSIVINPTVTSIAYPGSATAADPAGGETITVTGTGFNTGATVTIGGTAAPAVSYVSATQITFTAPAKAAGDYDIVVTNTDTGSATYINGISYNGIPTWTTPAGSLGTFASGATISTITLQATEPDAGTITFNITNGALPTGLSLTGANIDGTTTLETADTLYTFTVTATDDESQATPRTFTITVTKQFIGTENFTINTYTGNGSTQSIEGKIGTAASFNGTSSKINTGYIQNGQIFSASFWIKNINNGGSILRDTPSAGGSNTFMDIVANGNGTGIVVLGGVNLTGGTALNASSFTHYAVVLDGTNATIFENGSQVATTAYTPKTGNNGTPVHLMSNGAYPVGFGSGYLDQVRIFNKALSSSEVTTLSGENNTSTTKSTTDIFDDGSGVALYEFEEGAKDTGGVSGYIGAGGIFNGSNSGIVNTSFGISGNAARSYSAWVYTNGSTTGTICGIGNYGAAGQSMYFWIDQTNGGRWSLWGFTATYDLESQALPAIANLSNGWHHFVLTWDANQTFNVYIDGSLADTKTKAVTYNTPAIFAIGRWYSSGYWFNGKIDQVRIFNKAISSSEVTTLYGETSASATKSTTDIFDDSSGIALYELEGNANDTGDTYNGTATNVSYAYDGTPTNVSFVGTSFQPDFVWVKNRSVAVNHYLYDSIRGTGAAKALHSNTSDSEASSSAYSVNGGVQSIDSNGFTVFKGTDNIYQGTNLNGNNYVAWCWKAGGAAVSNTDGTTTSQVSANPDAGFSIVKYTGGGSVNVGHGLSSAPDLIINKITNASGGWVVYNSISGTGKYLYLNSTASIGTDSVVFSAVTDTTFTHNWSGNSYSYINYCFHSVDGYQKVGSYTGGGNTNPTINVGFTPTWLMVKRVTGGTGGWTIVDNKRHPGTPSYVNGNVLYADEALAEQDDNNIRGFNITSTGFTPNGNYATTNNNGDTYIYLAIA
jgi:hypothetical protein